ncbi:MAG: hypothetical protein JSU07_04525 [Bacteroidetes bacterium]|nr:hypothetical protein [Bacteroidota bacterium]
MRDKLNFIMGSVMVLITLSMACLFIFTDIMADKMYGSKRTVFIGLLIAYSLYRAYRSYLYFKKPTNTNSD